LMLANSIQYSDNWLWRKFYALKSLYLSKPNSSEHFRNVLQNYVIPEWIMKIYANVKGKLF
jgi:hypothetical protein